MYIDFWFCGLPLKNTYIVQSTDSVIKYIMNQLINTEQAE